MGQVSTHYLRPWILWATEAVHSVSFLVVTSRESPWVLSHLGKRPASKWRNSCSLAAMARSNGMAKMESPDHSQHGSAVHLAKSAPYCLGDSIVCGELCIRPTHATSRTQLGPSTALNRPALASCNYRADRDPKDLKEWPNTLQKSPGGPLFLRTCIACSAYSNQKCRKPHG